MKWFLERAAKERRVDLESWEFGLRQAVLPLVRDCWKRCLMEWVRAVGLSQWFVHAVLGWKVEESRRSGSRRSWEILLFIAPCSFARFVGRAVFLGMRC
ncbi:MAG: hypothetical protein JRG73_13390 [Deltaproteobacteria bacterium]|nr:hypothetical protein [Deltaproteobacteria bacterium]MBW2307913.1 hypothetical protein [Deltaproteobacteria bacterium]